MATVNTNDLRIASAKNLISSINGPSPDVDAYTYLFIGRPYQWGDVLDESIDDLNPPVYQNNIQDYNKAHHQMVSLKRIFDNKVFGMIKKYTWTSGTIYDMYRHDYSIRNTSASGSSNLYNSKFYTINSTYDVYVCLFNGTSPNTPGGTISSIEPMGTTIDPFTTSDGYQWLYLYSIPEAIRSYATNNLIPIIQSEDEPVVTGEINTIIINSRGTNYTSSPSGISNDIPYYFCNVTGDGSGCVARVAISLGGVDSVEVVRRGQGYTRATLVFKSGQVYKSLEDLDANINALNPLGNNNFNSTCIISPFSGWGKDLAKQLGATSIGIFGDIAFDESDFVNDMEFRQLGIIQNFEYSDIQYKNNPTLSAHHAVLVSTTGLNYQYMEQIAQTTTTGGVTRIAKGAVIGWDSSNNILRYIQDPDIHADTNGAMYPFNATNPIIGSASSATGTVIEDSIDVGGLVFVAGFSLPEINKFTGDIIYISNLQPVQRDENQTESIGIIINY